jgi:hypothetical protein
LGSGGDGVQEVGFGEEGGAGGGGGLIPWSETKDALLLLRTVVEHVSLVWQLFTVTGLVGPKMHDEYWCATGGGGGGGRGVDPIRFAAAEALAGKEGTPPAATAS